MSTNLPSFVFAGASFSGAEMLYELLKSNPALFFPKGKPSAFFYRSDLYDQGITPYQKLFDMLDSHKVAGDIGVNYFEHGIVLNAEKKYLWQPQEDAALRLKKHCPSTKIILCLRNPLERAYLQYKQAKAGRIEKTADFSSALSEELEGKRTPETHPLCYLYRNRVGHHTAHWKRLFGSENLHICFYEEIITNITENLETVESFIGVRAHKPDSLDITRVQQDLPEKLSIALEYLGRFPTLKPLQNLWLSRLQKNKTAPEQFPVLQSPLKESVTAFLAKDIKSLETLSGRKDLQALWPLAG